MRPSLSTLAPARRRLVLVLAALLALVLVAGVVVLLTSRDGSGGDVDQAEPGPVIVLPGYGGGTEPLDPLVSALRSEGRDVVVFKPTENEQGDLRVQARLLGRLASQTMRRTDASSVDVVGFSAGGVIARIYVRDEGGADVVRRVLTLGSPHHGSEIAGTAVELAGDCPEGCRQLAPGSDLLRQLNAGDETPAGPLWTTVRSDADQTVTPTVSARLDGALNLRVQALCPQATTAHTDIPGDPVTLAALSTVLGAGKPRSPRDVSC